MSDPIQPAPGRAVGDSGNARRTVGPSVLFLPLLALILGIFWQRGAVRERGAEPEVPPARAAAELVPGLRGSRDQVIVRFVPLHPDPARQAFDAGVLARRLELDAGEPWRALFVWSGEGAGPELDPGALRVHDAEGLALVPIVGAPPSTPDPLAVLLFAAPRTLDPGREHSVVFWGRPPGDGARLEGWTDHALALAPHGVERATLSGALARLEPDAEDDSSVGEAR